MRHIDSVPDRWRSGNEPKSPVVDVGMTAAQLALSVLDLVPVRTGQTTGEALTSSTRLAQIADDGGCTRYWVAEHHNSPGVASTSPPVIISLLAGATKQIRVGSGGVMLPNHAPLAVAEQFALLEAAFPGRIDLGIGRAPGTDPVTSWALRSGGGPEGDPVAQFDQFVQHVVAFASAEGAAIRLQDRDFVITATPHATSAPMVWLLGSSDYSARLAATLGLPYVFAHHFAGTGTAAALELYRNTYTGEGEPRTFLSVNAVTADSVDEARELALPYLHMMAALRTGSTERKPLLTVDEALAAPEPLPAPSLATLQEPWLLGPADEVAEGARALAVEYGVDEVMIHPIGGARETDPMDRVPSRERTVAELAERLVPDVVSNDAEITNPD